MYISAKSHPIWFNSHEEMWIFVRSVISPFHPSFVYIHLHKPVVLKLRPAELVNPARETLLLFLF